MKNLNEQYTLNYTMLLKGKICSRCPNETTGKRHGSLCADCVQASKVRRTALMVIRNAERVDCKCTICEAEITCARYAVKRAKCDLCRKADMEQKSVLTYAANRSYRRLVDPMGAFLTAVGESFDSYDIPPANKFLVRC